MKYYKEGEKVKQMNDADFARLIRLEPWIKEAECNAKGGDVDEKDDTELEDLREWLIGHNVKFNGRSGIEKLRAAKEAYLDELNNGEDGTDTGA